MLKFIHVDILYILADMKQYHVAIIFLMRLYDAIGSEL